MATGYKSALTEERRRYCFLVDRQCCVTKLLINYHSKVISAHSPHPVARRGADARGPQDIFLVSSWIELLYGLLILPGKRASVAETVVLATVVLSAHETSRASSEPAASHRASKLRGCWDSRGPPPYQDRLCSARTGQTIFFGFHKTVEGLD